MKKTFVFALLFVLPMTVMAAESRKISGKVMCPGDGGKMDVCIGAAVTCAQTITKGVAAGLDGGFDLECPKSEGIVASFVGLKDTAISAAELDKKYTNLTIELRGSVAIETVVIKSCHDEAKGIEGGTLVDNVCVPNKCVTPRWNLQGTGNDARCVEKSCANGWGKDAGGAWVCPENVIPTVVVVGCKDEAKGIRAGTLREGVCVPSACHSPRWDLQGADDNARCVEQDCANGWQKTQAGAWVCDEEEYVEYDEDVEVDGCIESGGERVSDDVCLCPNDEFGRTQDFDEDLQTCVPDKEEDEGIEDVDGCVASGGRWAGEDNCVCPPDDQGRPRVYDYDEQECAPTMDVRFCAAVRGAKWDVNTNTCVCEQKGYKLDKEAHECIEPEDVKIAKARMKIKSAYEELSALSDAKKTVWRDEEGKFNTARLASDSIAGVVLGTTGALVTSHLVKKKHVEDGFEDLECTIGGQTVAGWGDEFTVGIGQ